MTRTERGNVKTSPSCVTRDVMVQENVIKTSKRKHFASIMVFVTMARTITTLCSISQNSRGSDASGLLRTPKGGPKGAA
eukprot:11768531-Ditylum_brightwellii.AAC.1